MKKFLFVCTGNTCRSPMAEGIFNKLAQEKGWNTTAESAGLFATESTVSANSLQICKQNGIDISTHIPRSITKEIFKSADVVLTMTTSHKMALSGFDNVYTISEYFNSSGEISDPYGGTLEDYNNTFNQLKELIGKYNED